MESDTQEHCMQYTKDKSEICLVGDYCEIFREDIPQDIAKTLLKIVEFRKLSLVEALVHLKSLRCCGAQLYVLI